jgi:hypothetical protein
MTKFRLSGMLAPLQEIVSEAGDGAPTNKNIKKFTLHPDNPNHSTTHRNTLYVAWIEGSLATLAFFLVSSPPRLAGDPFGIKFDVPDQALIGDRKTFGQTVWLPINRLLLTMVALSDSQRR